MPDWITNAVVSIAASKKKNAAPTFLHIQSKPKIFHACWCKNVRCVFIFKRWLWSALHFAEPCLSFLSCEAASKDDARRSVLVFSMNSQRPRGCYFWKPIIHRCFHLPPGPRLCFNDVTRTLWRRRDGLSVACPWLHAVDWCSGASWPWRHVLASSFEELPLFQGSDLGNWERCLIGSEHEAVWIGIASMEKVLISIKKMSPLANTMKTMLVNIFCFSSCLSHFLPLSYVFLPTFPCLLVWLCVCACPSQPVSQPDCRSVAFLPTWLPSYLPGCLPTYLAACLPAWLPASMPTRLVLPRLSVFLPQNPSPPFSFSLRESP